MKRTLFTIDVPKGSFLQLQREFGVDTSKYDKSLDGQKVELITPEELSILPDGTELYSFFGEKVVKGVDVIDNDTRGGFLAYGFLKK